MRIIVLLLLAVGTWSTATAAEQVFTSGPERVTVIELFTSEGCSSCPPAEARLNTYAAHPELWRTFVPMAFHVDYWDYLGWRDRFAQPEFSKRQRRYAALRKVRTVYTPAFIVNGRASRLGGLSSATAPDDHAAGRLRVRLGEGTLEAGYDPPRSADGDVRLNVAVLGMGLHSRVRAGENTGRRLEHEFVVLHYGAHRGRDGRWRLPVPAVDAAEAQRLALAVWISAADDPTPLQATGGWITKRD